MIQKGNFDRASPNFIRASEISDTLALWVSKYFTPKRPLRMREMRYRTEIESESNRTKC